MKAIFIEKSIKICTLEDEDLVYLVGNFFGTVGKDFEEHELEDKKRQICRMIDDGKISLEEFDFKEITETFEKNYRIL